MSHENAAVFKHSGSIVEGRIDGTTLRKWRVGRKGRQSLPATVHIVALGVRNQFVPVGGLELVAQDGIIGKQKHCVDTEGRSIVEFFPGAGNGVISPRVGFLAANPRSNSG